MGIRTHTHTHTHYRALKERKKNAITATIKTTDFVIFVCDEINAKVIEKEEKKLISMAIFGDLIYNAHIFSLGLQTLTDF